MAVLRDKEEEKGQGTSQALGQPAPGQMQPQEQAEPQQAQPSGPATIGGSSATQTSAPVKAMPKQQKAGTGSFANLKTYLQAAQGGGQQRVAQAATQQVQRLGAGAQKGVQQAQESFKGQLGAGSGAIFKGAQPGEFLSAEDVAKQAQATTGSVLGTARGVTYQAPQAASQVQAVPTQNKTDEQLYTRGGWFESQLGDRYLDFQKELDAINSVKVPKDLSGEARTEAYRKIARDTDALYAKYGVKPPPIVSGPAPIRPPEGTFRSKTEPYNLEDMVKMETPTTTKPQQYFKPEDLEAFSNIINAQYQGPASLQQAGLYEQAARKARAAQQAGELTQTAGGREQLLRDVFGRGRDYSRGASRLDALLLNASEQGVQQLQQQAQPALQAQQALQEAQNVSANEAAQRARDIERIRTGARTAFTEARAAEETATENRIKSLIETPVTDAEGKILTKADGTPMTEWDRLPEYFKQSLSSKVGSQVMLSPEEAAVLGVGAGEGLYNIRPEDIQATKAERERLITKDELSRQLALQQLAGTDISKELQRDLPIATDLEKAGTQDLASSLDVEAFRRSLDEAQQRFKEAAQQATLTGTGKKKVSRGNLTGKKTKTYYADVSGNVADMLRQAGYDVGAEGEAVRSLLTDRDLLNKYLEATSTSRDEESNIGGSALEGTAAGAGTGAGIGYMVGGGVGAGVGAAVGGMAGGMAGANTIDSAQYYTDLAKELEEKLGIRGLGTAGQAVQDIRVGAGNVFGETYGKALEALGLGKIGSGIRGAISGIDTGAMKAYGSAKARQGAIKDLQKQYAKFLQGQGFENRVNIADTEATRARTAALQQLLRRQG